MTDPKIDLKMHAQQTKASHELHELHRFEVCEIRVICGKGWMFVRHRVHQGRVKAVSDPSIAAQLQEG